MRIRFALSLLLVLACGSTVHAQAWQHLPPGADAWPRNGEPAIRGVTVGPIESSQQPGRGYGTPYSARLLDELSRMGVQWVSITPFGRLWSLSSTDIQMGFEAPYEDNRRAIGRFVAQAHARGMRVLLIPHLWIETGGWRGEIDFDSPASWARYRRSYRRFVMRWAKDAAAWGVEAMSIGVECTSWSGRFGGFWTSFIRDVREVFPGLLTYSANWDEAEGVLFWDQLDLIGINAFYPLADQGGASYAAYLEGARRAVAGVGELADVLGMPVLFVEVGYTARQDAAVKPWLWPDHMQNVVVDEWEQARAMAALFEAALPHPWLAGFFVWRYYANLDDVSQEAIWGFSPHGKLAEPLLVDTFSRPWGADPPMLPLAPPRPRPTWLAAPDLSVPAFYLPASAPLW